MWREWYLVRQIKLFYIRFVRIRGEAEDIAEGMALGIFLGMTPTLGFQMLLAVLISALFKKNKIAAVLGVWISNPLTAPFIYLAEYEFARLLLGWDRIGLPTQLTLNEMVKLGWDVMVPLWLGGLVFGIVGGVLAYFLTLKMVPIAKTCHIPRWPRAHRKTEDNPK
jgi:uncharacterized protein